MAEDQLFQRHMKHPPPPDSTAVRPNGIDNSFVFASFEKKAVERRRVVESSTRASKHPTNGGTVRWIQIDASDDDNGNENGGNHERDGIGEETKAEEAKEVENNCSRGRLQVRPFQCQSIFLLRFRGGHGRDMLLWLPSFLGCLGYRMSVLGSCGYSFSLGIFPLWPSCYVPLSRTS